MMSHKIIAEGQRLFLRRIELEDAGSAYHRWLNDPEVYRFLETQKPNLDEIKKYVEGALKDPRTFLCAICNRADKKHIGNIKLGLIDQKNKKAEIGLFIGEREFWGKGYATEAIKLLSDYALKNLNLRKLIAGACASDKGSIRAFEKVGYAIEGNLKGSLLLDGKAEDHILMGLLVDR